MQAEDGIRNGGWRRCASAEGWGWRWRWRMLCDRLALFQVPTSGDTGQKWGTLFTPFATNQVTIVPQFRLAVENDADLLLEFMQAYYVFDGHGFDREKARTALVSLLRDARFGRAWFILDGASAVGYIVLCFGYSLEWLGRDAF